MNGASTIPEALLATAERGAGEYVFHLEDGPVGFSCAELAERAQLGARRLLALGVEPGDAVGVLGPNRPQWVVSAFAIWAAGCALVPAQLPLRIRDGAVFGEQLRRLVEAADCRRVLADPRLAPLLPAGIGVPWDESGEASGEEPLPPVPDRAAVIQFTSGSTATPRGALVTHAAVMAQMEILDEFNRDGDRVRSSANWTPFFHDLGLFLNVLPAAVWGLTGHHLPDRPLRTRPRRVAAAHIHDPGGCDDRPIGGLRPRRQGGRRRFGARRPQLPRGGAFRRRGHRPTGHPPIDRGRAGPRPGPEALGSSYGLAEAVLAVSYSSPGSGLVIDRSRSTTWPSSGMATPVEAEPSRLLTGCGRPKMELQIVGPEDEDLPERHVGEILLQGRSLMSGYVGPGADDPFVDGWMRTGDLGYLAGGELFVTGRLKDMMIAMGHNYYPEDFEWAAARVDGVRPRPLRRLQPARHRGGARTDRVARRRRLATGPQGHRRDRRRRRHPAQRCPDLTSRHGGEDDERKAAPRRHARPLHERCPGQARGLISERVHRSTGGV